MGQTEIALGRRGIKVSLNDLRLRKLANDFERPIGASAVDDQNSLGPGQLRQGAPNIGLFVECEDHRSDLMKQARPSRLALKLEYRGTAPQGAPPWHQCENAFAASARAAADIAAILRSLSRIFSMPAAISSGVVPTTIPAPAFSISSEIATPCDTRHGSPAANASDHSDAEVFRV